MRIITNDEYISRRESIGRYANLAGMGILGIALLLSCTVTLPMAVAQVMLTVSAVVGLLLFFLGSLYGERFSGPLAHHRVFIKTLKGLDKRYTLFQHILPVPNVLLGPDGLTILVARSQSGQVSFADGKWHHSQRGKLLRELTGQERLGKPELEAEWLQEKLVRHLAKHIPGIEVPIRSVVVFVHPDVELELDDPPIASLHERELKSWLRGPGMGKNLNPEAFQQLETGLVTPHLQEE